MELAAAPDPVRLEFYRIDLIDCQDARLVVGRVDAIGTIYSID